MGEVNGPVQLLSRAWRRPTVSLRDGLGGHDNALGIIRLVLAASVILSHAFPLGGWGEDPVLAWTRGQANLGGIAVVGFFAISGYLITKSGMRGDVVTFMWHRFLRIFPAFWLVLLVGAFLVGPVAWVSMGRPISTYLSSPDGPFSYLLANWHLSIHQYGIADIFLTTTPYGASAGSVLNGSLWTLEHEWFCYLIVAALVLTTIIVRPRLVAVVVPALAAGAGAIQVGIVFFGHNAGSLIPFMASTDRSELVFVFLVGACLAIFSRRIRIDDRVALLSLVVLVLSLLLGGLRVFGLPAIAYLTLWLAARLPRSWRRVGAVNDYSYGIYVYGFLVEQVLASLGAYRLGYLLYVLFSLIITGACAWVSWHLVEKRALAVKDRGPGRGLTYWYGRLRHRHDPPVPMPDQPDLEGSR